MNVRPHLEAMDKTKRNRLVQRLSDQAEPQLVSISEFLDGNDDVGSIGCNLLDHPGMDAFRTAFSRVAQRDDVHAIYAQIAELDPGEDSWPFTDTIYVVGSLPQEDLEAELSGLEPDEVGAAEDFGVPDSLVQKYKTPILAAWWD